MHCYRFINIKKTLRIDETIVYKKEIVTSSYD